MQIKRNGEGIAPVLFPETVRLLSRRFIWFACVMKRSESHLGLRTLLLFWKSPVLPMEVSRKKASASIGGRSELLTVID